MNDKKISVYAMRVNDKYGYPYKGEIIEIDNTDEAIRSIIGGDFEIVWINDEICIVKHLLQKEKQLTCNRIWVSDSGRIVDVLSGNFICARVSDETQNLASILEEDIDMIEKRLYPVMAKVGVSVMAIPTELLRPYQGE